MRRRWQPGIAIRLSILIHLGALIVAFARPALWIWILVTLLANHLLLGLIGMWPKSRWLGPNMLRLPEAAAQRGEVALTFDDGPDPDITPQVLELLDRHQARASFFVIGERAAAHPEIVREILRRGHSVENHSLRHSGFFGFFGLRALKREIATAQDTIAGITGRAPAFFRSPMGIRNPMLDPVIAALGLQYVTWTRRGFDTIAGDPQTVLARLKRGLRAGDILLLHDRKTASRTPPVLSVLPALLETLRAAGLRPVSLPMAMQ
jgi:peptidoglycan/xylan/chitin deacetylase (PgdA/CDA1 family)